MKKYFKVTVRFRNQVYKCIVICEKKEELTGEVVCDIVCKKLQTTIPSSEISFALTETSLLSTLIVHNLDTFELPVPAPYILT